MDYSKNFKIQPTADIKTNKTCGGEYYIGLETLIYTRNTRRVRQYPSLNLDATKQAFDRS